jgi:hypothetical protein
MRLLKYVDSVHTPQVPKVRFGNAIDNVFMKLQNKNNKNRKNEISQ